MADWSAVGCGTGSASKRAVSDVSADADPYTGMAMYDSSAECEYEEHGRILTGPWCTIGGTSLASPIIAATFALAGGAHGVQYPARTLYENETAAPGSLHDVETGSNGECPLKFDPANGLSGCTSAEEASNSKCSGELICLAAKGYDGPSGVGTPDGIAAFRPPGEEAKKQAEEKKKAEEKRLAEKLLEEERQHEKKKQEEAKRKEEAAAKNPGGGSTTGTSTTGAGSISPANGASGGSSSSTTTSSTSGRPTTIKLTAFALTPSALVALNRARPPLSAVAFAFTLSADARVHATLAKLIRVRGHDQWRLVRSGPTFAATKGRNRRRLANRGALTPGRYRLTLAPQNGSARSITFEIG
jgi:hypothetical protein